MTEKEKLTARLNELDTQLGREMNINGTTQELSMRITELKEELDEGTNTDNVENGGANDGSASTDVVDPVPPVDTVLNGGTDDALTAVEALTTLHIEALHATHDEWVSIVEAGAMIRVIEADADGLVTLRLVREH